MNCYVCNTEITKSNETYEHIIINAAGGRLKSKKLICIKCNSNFGETIDNKLAEQLNSLANILMVNRHRGDPKPIVAIKKPTGEKYTLEVGGKPKLTKPTIEKTIDGDITNFSISARYKKELREIVTGIAKKYPYFDVEEAIKTAQIQEKYLEEALHFNISIGGDEVFRAVCKCATNFFVYSKGDSSQIKHLIPYLKGEEVVEIIWFHYQKNLYKLEQDECTHIIHLIGKKDERILYCYVDFFNTFKYLVLLNDKFEGQDIKETYCFDLLNLIPIYKDVIIDYDRNTLLNFFSNKDARPFDEVKKAVERSITIGLKRQDLHHRSTLIRKVLHNSLGKYPEGVPITKEMINEIVTEFMEILTPYFFNRIK